MLSRRLNLFLLPLLLVAFGYGMFKLFELRFSQGDIYAPYSSLRADPVGTKALFDAFDRLPEIECRRLYESLEPLNGGADTTLLVLGTGPDAFRWIARDDIRKMEQFMHQGGRLVFALMPYPKRSYWDERNEKNTRERARDYRRSHDRKRGRDQELEDPKGPQKKDADETQDLDGKRKRPDSRVFPGSDSDDEEFKRWRDKLVRVSLLEEWGVKLEWKDLPLDEEQRPVPASAVRWHTADPGLTPTLPLHTAAVFNFDEEATEWRVIYERRDDPVVIERSFGDGSVVLAADSYWFSNEAMRQERDLGLLNWFIGDAGRVVFDEEHLGVTRSDGVATLGRKYRLHGLVAGLTVLALLFIWKNATTLVPPLDDAVVTGSAVTGRESGAGFVNLLRRTVPPDTLLSTCVREWSHANPGQRDRTDAMKEIATRENRERRAVAVVKKYREICELLKHK